MPNYVQGSGGEIQGFRFVWIKPGGTFEKLGFAVGDVIKGVNGEEINDPRKAMEAYQALRDSNNFNINMSRKGKDEDFQYSLE